MENLTTAVGVIAACCTSASYAPQVLKCWRSGSTGDLSLKMLVTLSAGIALWVLYGLLQSDLVIIGANTISLALLSYLLAAKIRSVSRAGPNAPSAPAGKIPR